MEPQSSFVCRRQLEMAGMVIQLFAKAGVKGQALPDQIIVGSRMNGTVAWVFRPDADEGQLPVIWDIAPASVRGEGQLEISASLRKSRAQDPQRWTTRQYQLRLDPWTGELLGTLNAVRGVSLDANRS